MILSTEKVTKRMQGYFCLHFIMVNGAYLEITASPLLDDKGLRYGDIESIRDITERKKDEIQLKKSEQHFRNVVESAPDVIVTTDAEGNILSYNDSMENIFG